MKQYIKNKRRHAYRQQVLDVPEKYTYLKANSAKRNPSASRKRRAGAASAPKKAVAAAKKAATVRSKKTKNTDKLSTKAKGKKKAQVVSDDEDDSMGEPDDEDEAMVTVCTCFPLARSHQHPDSVPSRMTNSRIGSSLGCTQTVCIHYLPSTVSTASRTKYMCIPIPYMVTGLDVEITPAMA